MWHFARFFDSPPSGPGDSWSVISVACLFSSHRSAVCFGPASNSAAFVRLRSLQPTVLPGTLAKYDVFLLLSFPNTAVRKSFHIEPSEVRFAECVWRVVDFSKTVRGIIGFAAVEEKLCMTACNYSYMSIGNCVRRV